MFRLDPTSRIALILRRWRSKIGIAAPRVAIRTELPWHWRALSVIVLAGCSLALAGWIYSAGLRFAGFHIESSTQELAELRAQVERLTAELDSVSRVANSSDSRLKIEATAQDRLASQLKRLEEENTRLKADLAMFEKLAGDDQGPAGLEISRLQVFQDGGGNQYRYRMLVAQKGSARTKEFKGSLKLVLSLSQGAVPVKIELPGERDARSDQFSVAFRRFGRLEGGFDVPEGMQLKGVEARLLESGTVHATSTITL